MSAKKTKKVRYSKKSRNKKTINSRISGKTHPRYGATMTSGADSLPPKDAGQRVTNARIDSAGRLLVPAPFRKALEVQAGDEVNLMLKGGVLEVRSLNAAIREAQALVRRHVSKRKSLVKELIKDRRQEAGRE
jgi:bifunctional DNA-binding transcriptional regulator/antitoxin component of YhaV-PrlF toxin-antitoxin module